MLIFTRKIGEAVRIGDQIQVKIIDIKGKQVRIGIEAPLEISVHREEIYQKILQENLQAATVETGDLNKVADMWRRKE